MNDLDLGWAIGFFEGEGCVYRIPAGIRLQIYNTDLDVMEKFARIIGGKITGPYMRNVTKREIETGYLPVSEHKLKYSWTEARQNRTKEILDLFWLHLGQRRQLRCIELGYSPL